LPARARIRSRLTAWYAGMALALLLVTIFSMRRIAIVEVMREYEARVAQTARLVRLFFRTELAEYNQIEVTLAHISAELVFTNMEVEFLRPGGQTFARARTPAGGALINPPVRELVLPLDEVSAPGWGLRMRISDEDILTARQNIDRATLVSIPLVLIAAALAAWFLTGRALRPVAEMARAAELITGSIPTGRLPIANSQDEFGRLGMRFNEVLDRLDAALRQQRNFLDDAAHELRTPIARMMSATELRLASTDVSADRATLGDVRADLGRASRLVDELLQLARADSGSSAALETGNLDDIVSDAVAPWQGEARRRGIAFVVDQLEESLVRLDSRLIDRLVGILTENALRYTAPGGTVRLRVIAGPATTTLRVEDSGIGIPREDRARVFSRFYRGVKARQIEPEGNGLGLAIAQWIAGQHGATIELGDSEFSGARIDVVFPRADASNKGQAATVSD
jgi:two-component system, OmpR family, sensor kinase